VRSLGLNRKLEAALCPETEGVIFEGVGDTLAVGLGVGMNVEFGSSIEKYMV
jgi:hypothetical protein